jgi:hypothetical protein
MQAPPPPATAERPLHDKAWRRQERRRIARLNRLPDPFRCWADRGRWQTVAVNVLQALVAIAIGLVVVRALSGGWLAPYSAVVVLAVAVGLQAVCRSVNRRADARAGR